MPGDLVVVLPGITGSTLALDGSPVWAPSAGVVLRSITTLGRNLSRLTLPADLGDEHPGDGVEPVALMPDLHALPGVWTPVKGYDRLLARLRALGYTEDNGGLLPVPYDWRLSNRYNGQRLAGIVEPALERLRRTRPEARIVFVCHSMGGLVARWYVEMCGGAEHTRKLITLGTPFRGAPKALRLLANGLPRAFGPPGPGLVNLAGSLPSLHQLLPTYACLDQGTHLLNLSEHPVVTLRPAMVADALAFHTALEAAETPDSLTRTHAVVGVRQLTATTVRFDGVRATTVDTIEGVNEYGDGTVPLVGAIGHGLPLDTNAVHRVADRHGNLHRNAHALDQVEQALTTRPIRRRDADTAPLGLDVPDLLLSGDRLSVRVDLPPTARAAVRVTVSPEHGRPVHARTIARSAHLTIGPLRPGAYEITATGPGVTPVTATTVVWDPTG